MVWDEESKADGRRVSSRFKFSGSALRRRLPRQTRQVLVQVGRRLVAARHSSGPLPSRS